MTAHPGTLPTGNSRPTVPPSQTAIGAAHTRKRRLCAKFVKRLIDVSAAGILLIIFAPLLVTLVVVVRSGSAGPALFRQVRVGRGERDFILYKFRTMHVGADQYLTAIADQNWNSDGPLFKMQHDPRVTRAGRWMRKYSLDELPQLFNVLIGSMSLVGPRPALPSEVASYSDVARKRLSVRPGMTGLWQISGRSDLSWPQSLLMDLRYVNSWTVLFDLYILILTIPAVISTRGAY